MERPDGPITLAEADEDRRSIAGWPRARRSEQRVDGQRREGGRRWTRGGWRRCRRLLNAFEKSAALPRHPARPLLVNTVTENTPR